MYRLRQDALTWQQVGDDVVVLDLEGSQYFRLNGTGAVLWAALSEGAEHDDLAHALSSTFDVSHDRADADVARFVADLRDQGLLES